MEIDISKLKPPAVSQQGLKVLDIIGRDDVDMNILGNGVTSDPMLSATLLKYANSPVYRRMIEIKNVRNAISLLGMTNVKAAIMVATMRTYCQPINLVKERLWQHTIRVSILAKLIAGKYCRSIMDEVELTALIHDIGALVLATNYPAEYEKVLDTAEKDKASIEEVEKRIFGVAHDEVTAYFASSMRLPEVTKNALLDFHVRPPLETIDHDSDRHIAVVALAHIIEQELQSVVSFKESLAHNKQHLLSSLQMNENMQNEVIEKFADTMSQGYSL